MKKHVYPPSVFDIMSAHNVRELFRKDYIRKTARCHQIYKKDRLSLQDHQRGPQCKILDRVGTKWLRSLFLTQNN